jgi:hypothetical protein
VEAVLFSKLKSSGQAIVEFVLIIPVVLLLVMGALDLGRAFFVKIALTNSAREGAYYLSYHPSDKTTCDPLNPSVCYWGTIQAVQREAVSAGVNIQPANVSVTSCCTSGQPVAVTVSQTINLSIYHFFFGPLNLNSTVRMRMQ